MQGFHLTGSVSKSVCEDEDIIGGQLNPPDDPLKSIIYWTLLVFLFNAA